MTCIVAVVAADGAIWMGGDSLGSDGQSALVRSEPKVVRRGAFLFGRSGDLRPTQVLFHAFTPPPHPDGKDALAYLVTDFAKALRQALVEHNVHLKDEEIGCEVLIGYRGRLFGLECNFGVSEIARDYHAVGSGDQVALGALYGTRVMELVLSPERRVRLALEAAAEHVVTVRGPFTVLCSGQGGA